MGKWSSHAMPVARPCSTRSMAANLAPFPAGSPTIFGSPGPPTEKELAYLFHDEKSSAPVYRIDLQTGKRELINTITVSDPAGVTSIQAVRITPDGKSYVYSYSREQSDLFVVEGVH